MIEAIKEFLDDHTAVNTVIIAILSINQLLSTIKIQRLENKLNTFSFRVIEHEKK